MQLRGSISVLELYDVGDELRLQDLPRLIGGQAVSPGFKHTAPEYVRFERPPVIEQLEPVTISTGEQFAPTLHYYDYGVVSVVLRYPFAGDWQRLQELAARWVSSPAFDELSLRIVREKVATIRAALVRPYEQWQVEDYCIFHVFPSVELPTASELLRHNGLQISQIVRGEVETLAEAERAEVMQASISYYPSDLAVVGWSAAFVFDNEQGAAATIRILEYANSQLLQFRHYDEILTRQLSDVYRFLERRGGVLAGWRMRPAAANLRTILLELTELTERTNNALKFVGDMFTARFYKLCATRIGVNDYQQLVAEKLSTAENLYSVMIGQFNQARGFLLESMVVIILIIELILLLRGGR